MSKDLVKLNWDLVKQADVNASRHNEVLRKVADIGEYMQDPDIQNAMMAGGAGMLGGAAMGAFGEKDEDESRAWKILKNTLGFGGAAALLGYGAGPASRALGGPNDPLYGAKNFGRGLYNQATGTTPDPTGNPAANEDSTSIHAGGEPGLDNSGNLVPTQGPAPPPIPEDMPTQGPAPPPMPEDAPKEVKSSERFRFNGGKETPGQAYNRQLMESWAPYQRKQAGYWSEAFGGMNPLNVYGGNLIGSGAALATPTRNMREQAESDESTWSNLLIPGVAPYNVAKRLGHSIRGPELQEIKARQAAEAEHAKSHMQEEEHREENPEDDEQPKEAGYWSEQFSMLNPLNYPALPFAGGAALATPTRNLEEQAEADKSTWSNLLVPGKGPYNSFKRLGTSVRGPEITKEREDLKTEKRRKALDRGKPVGKKDDDKKDDKKDEEKEGAAIGAYLAKQAVNTSKWEDKSRKKKRSKVRISGSGQAHLSKKKKKKVKSAADNSPKVKQVAPPARRKVTPLPARPKTPATTAGNTRSA
jgi:hypothetical protein